MCASAEKTTITTLWAAVQSDSSGCYLFRCMCIATKHIFHIDNELAVKSTPSLLGINFFHSFKSNFFRNVIPRVCVRARVFLSLCNYVLYQNIWNCFRNFITFSIVFNAHSAFCCCRCSSFLRQQHIVKEGEQKRNGRVESRWGTKKIVWKTMALPSAVTNRFYAMSVRGKRTRRAS